MEAIAMRTDQTHQCTSFYAGRLEMERGLFFGGFGFGGGVSVFLGEAFDAASSVHQLLFAGEERVAVRTDFNAKHFALHRGASLKCMAAGAVHRDRVIVRVNSKLHGTPICRVRSARPIR
jgi:hypothetical protein